MLRSVPIHRERIRWALACYRRNTGIGIPTLFNEIVNVLGEDRVIDALTQQDLYNFLQNKVQTRTWKLEIISDYLREVAPSYILEGGQEALGQSLCDLLLRYAIPNFDPIEDRFGLAEQADLVDGFLFGATEIETRHDPSLVRSANPIFDGLVCHFMLIQRIGNSPHLTFVTFSTFFPAAMEGKDSHLRGDPKKEKILSGVDANNPRARTDALEIVSRVVTENSNFEEKAIHNLNRGVVAPTPQRFKYVGFSKNPESVANSVSFLFAEDTYTNRGRITLSALHSPLYSLGYDYPDPISPIPSQNRSRNFYSLNNTQIENIFNEMEWGF